MKRKKWQHAKTLGNKTESIIESWLQSAGVEYKQENTMRNTRTRSKGSIDFESDKIAIEVKRFTKTLSFKFQSEDHDIKWSQIEYLSKMHNQGKVSGLVITEDDKTFYFIRINDFLLFWVNSKRKSINAGIALKIGFEINDMEWIKEVV